MINSTAIFLISFANQLFVIVTSRLGKLALRLLICLYRSCTHIFFHLSWSVSISPIALTLSKLTLHLNW